MSEPSESPTGPVVDTASQPGRPSRLNQVAAWVGIVAGIVFIVALIFFSGFCAGTYSGRGYWHGGYRHYQPQQGPSCTMGPGPMMGPGMAGPGTMGPGTMGPGGMMPGMMPPGQRPGAPTTPSPRP